MGKVQLQLKLNSLSLLLQDIRDSLNKFALEDPTFTVRYFITGEGENVSFEGTECTQEDVTIKYGRISQADVESCLTNNLNIASKKETLAYVCGPPPMIQHVQDMLKSLEIENVLYEKWW